ncbi:Methyltransferase family protein [Forsythia ovata]|uniref:Methyltransferase family protein n=1 Tax=Forsythia ovata TaxID=205694 RepID=A0ABD1WHK6_9LAMI
MSKRNWVAENYYSKDFEWDELRQEVENDPSLQYHLLPYTKVDSENQDRLQDSEAWDKFHALHSTGKFFKERRYLLKEFPELASCKDYYKILEVGCGNGSTALPILREKESTILYACDCSTEALERAKEIINADNSISTKHRFHPFQCDFSTLGFPMWLACNTCRGSFLEKRYLGFPAENNCKIAINSPSCSEESECCIGGVDFITLPGGLLLFRDYGLYDMTMLRFEPEQRVGYREYLRSDGTRSYFFCLNSVRNLTSAAGLH